MSTIAFPIFDPCGIVVGNGCDARRTAAEVGMLTLYTLGDSILDCGRFNGRGVTPGGLLVRNDDDLFPEFRGQELTAHGPARLVHQARSGSTVADLPAQGRGL